jgi:hypothetical protein
MSDAVSFALASSVMAATEKVVSQALEGAWSEVPRTLEQRRELLSQLSAQAGTAEHAWLQALQQAVAESDSAVEAMAPAAALSVQAQAQSADDMLHTALRQSLINARGASG